MGMVVEFPAEATQRRSATTDLSRREGMGMVLILPVIRIERHEGDVFGGGSSDSGAPSGRRGRKRRVRP
jgi:hypothetical protein